MQVVFQNLGQSSMFPESFLYVSLVSFSQRKIRFPAKSSIYDAGLPHPPSPPPTPWYPPLPVKWVVVLFGLVAFPVWSCLASSPLPPPPPVEWGLWSFWLAPPRLWGGSVLYRRMVWLLPLVSSNVIVTCLVPPWPRPACGAVCSTKICMVWLLPLVSSNVIVTCSLPYKIALFSLQTVPLSLL